MINDKGDSMLIGKKQFGKTTLKEIDTQVKEGKIILSGDAVITVEGEGAVGEITCICCQETKVASHLQTEDGAICHECKPPI
jgi:ABC-type branched-subunit amino acid transport system ATPase component